MNTNKLSDEERQKIFIDNEKLVYHILKKYRNKLSFMEEKDLIQNGMIGLWKGCLTIQIDSISNKMSTYLGRCIDNEYLMLIRDYYERDKFKTGNSTICNMLSLDSVVSEHEDLKWEDLIGDDNVNIEEQIMDNETTKYYIKIIKEILESSKLKEIDKEVFFDITTRGKPQNLIALERNLSRQRISQIYLKVLNYIKLRFKDMEIE